MEIDRKTLKALSADTRLDILKSLSKRRKMPSELAKELNLATSTVIEHLDRLEEANLVKREETGHKWIYYSLTEKGESLIKPKVPVQFVLIICLSLIVIFSLIYVSNLNIFPSFQVNQAQETSKLATNLTECTSDSDCAVGGCSKQICGKRGEVEKIVTTCEWKEEYECLRLTSCKCIQNKCQWEQTKEYEQCLANLP